MPVLEPVAPRRSFGGACLGFVASTLGLIGLMILAGSF
jgi:hypothetical protein